MLDKDTVKHVANLCRLEFKEEEMDGISKKLGDILGYVEKLKSVDTESVDITYNPINLTNVFREDEVKKSLDREKVLQNAPDKEMGCFKVPKVLD
ncbi:Asp-tRNA(Asn)/Glu-tRNA(Gln) amidotransferase subunit GatC [Tepidibacter thalassicus]|uniref:Aspartyl/glutamyl-tRNA(Asn/Gln) amidotransferase subunit C n=1 Tax=Tepidibacter thalassicus DSM 15285 TaxID=1123350 RepID=A0A1M5RK14_9FIRM|nr:Asp-tRNA(Asn)/Glu-tRNA(Gln) amidotransferase subunit GatC [Tepidibacter thalassicus]SHH26540.1 aspartyl/glutamyl-tRNA(Asn/Gln) amidotransferase subunit C [Tepidibacter thalassicus DSM 15285]